MLGERILAWVGGLAVVLAATFFVVTAVRRGWIDVPTRISLAFLGSTILVLVGVWLHERKGQTQAARALVASGIASIYLTIVAATQVYHLIAPAPAFVIAGVVAVASTLIAVRWNSRLVAGLGIGGALLSPVLVDAGTSTSALTFMAIAVTGSVAVLVWRSWTWLGLMTFALSAPQLLEWAAGYEHRAIGATLVVLVLFWALYLVAAAGFEMRVPTASLRLGAGALMSLDAILITATGWAVLDQTGRDDAATAWVLLFAAIHVTIGLASRLSARVNPDFGSLAITLGLVYSAVGLALALDGAALVAAWGAEAVCLAAVGRARDDWRVSDVGLGFLALAAGHTLVLDAPPRGLVEGGYDTSQALLAIAFTIAAIVGVAVLAPADEPGLRRLAGLGETPVSLRVPLAGFSLAALLYLLAYGLDGTALVAAWAALAVAMVAVAATLRAPRLAEAALAPLGLAAMHVLVFEAPPRALFYGVDDLGAAALSIAAVVAATVAASVMWPQGESLFGERAAQVRVAVVGAAGAAALYLASVAIVDMWGVTAQGERLQGGQLALSTLWGATGIALLVFGLTRDIAWLRRGGLALLVIAVVKVFTYDLSELTDLARVASLLLIGLVLIAAAFFYQRLRAQHDGARLRHP